uniref:Putative secreted protein n=1 Tax=Ixodes ricinus TaxID=34613 RepID=A0A6B0U3A7_IXORI
MASVLLTFLLPRISSSCLTSTSQTPLWLLTAPGTQHSRRHRTFGSSMVPGVVLALLEGCWSGRVLGFLEGKKSIWD